MSGVVQLIGRVMLALIFILAGIGKIMDPAGTSGYMESMGVTSLLMWPTVALELLAGIALAVGYRSKLAATTLALFCLVAAALFHNDLGDKMQMILFLKNIAIAGGLLLVATSATTALSLDRKKESANFFATRR